MPIMASTPSIREIDGVSRRIAFRKLPGFPVYALAGITSAAIQADWLAAEKNQLIVGLPATLAIFAVLWIALRRTRRLYEEADRREAAEGALRQAQRLEAIGQLTGGVAHDFNNLLMIVSGSVHRLRRHVGDDKQKRLLDAIDNATQRGESLTRQLLAFSRRQMLQPSVIDLAERLPDIKDCSAARCATTSKSASSCRASRAWSRSTRASSNSRCSISPSMRATRCRRAAR